jgi:hypothetical protein
MPQTTSHAAGLDLDDLGAAGRSGGAELFDSMNGEFAAAHHPTVVLPTHDPDDARHVLSTSSGSPEPASTKLRPKSGRSVSAGVRAHYHIEKQPFSANGGTASHRHKLRITRRVR